MPRKLSRRAFVTATTGAALGAGGLVALRIGRGSVALPEPRLRSPEEQARAREGLRALLCPIVPGDIVAGSLVERVFVDAQGVGVILLVDAAGETYRVDVCRREEGGPRPVAATRHYSLFLRNGGDGRRPTAEQRGLPVMALGAAIRSNEEAEAELDLARKSELWARVGA